MGKGAGKGGIQKGQVHPSPDPTLAVHWPAPGDHNAAMAAQNFEHIPPAAAGYDILQDVVKALIDKTDAAGEILLVADFRQQQAHLLQNANSLPEYVQNFKQILRVMGITGLGVECDDVEKDAAVVQMRRLLRALSKLNGQQGPKNRFSEMAYKGNVFDIPSGAVVGAVDELGDPVTKNGSKYYAINKDGTLSEMERNGMQRNWEGERKYEALKARVLKSETELRDVVANYKTVVERAQNAERDLDEFRGRALAAEGELAVVKKRKVELESKEAEQDKRLAHAEGRLAELMGSSSFTPEVVVWDHLQQRVRQLLPGRAIELHINKTNEEEEGVRLSKLQLAQLDPEEVRLQREYGANAATVDLLSTMPPGYRATVLGFLGDPQMQIIMMSLPPEVQGQTIPMLSTDMLERVQRALTKEQFAAMVGTMGGSDTYRMLARLSPSAKAGFVASIDPAQVALMFTDAMLPPKEKGMLIDYVLTLDLRPPPARKITRSIQVCRVPKAEFAKVAARKAALKKEAEAAAVARAAERAAAASPGSIKAEPPQPAVAQARGPDGSKQAVTAVDAEGRPCCVRFVGPDGAQVAVANIDADGLPKAAHRGPVATAIGPDGQAVSVPPAVGPDGGPVEVSFKGPRGESLPISGIAADGRAIHVSDPAAATVVSDVGAPLSLQPPLGADGQRVPVTFVDMDGAPVAVQSVSLDGSLVAVQAEELAFAKDYDGAPVTLTCKDAETGASLPVRFVDPEGRAVEVQAVSYDGQPVALQAPVLVTAVGADGQPVTVAARDAEGNAIAATFLSADEDRKPVSVSAISSTGVPVGHMDQVVVEAVDSYRAPCPIGAADGDGRATAVHFVTEDGAPAAVHTVMSDGTCVSVNAEGESVAVYSVDSQGNQVKVAAGRPGEDAATVQFVDAAGEVCSVMAVTADGKPILFQAPVAVGAFGPDGQPVAVSAVAADGSPSAAQFIGLSGAPAKVKGLEADGSPVARAERVQVRAIGPDGQAATIQATDADGNPVSAQFVSGDGGGSPVGIASVSRAGEAKGLTTKVPATAIDPRDGQPVLVRCVDENGDPCVGLFVGANGHTAPVASISEDGSPVGTTTETVCRAITAAGAEVALRAATDASGAPVAVRFAAGGEGGGGAVRVFVVGTEGELYASDQSELARAVGPDGGPVKLSMPTEGGQPDGKPLPVSFTKGKERATVVAIESDGTALCEPRAAAAAHRASLAKGVGNGVQVHAVGPDGSPVAVRFMDAAGKDGKPVGIRGINSQGVPVASESGKFVSVQTLDGEEAVIIAPHAPDGSSAGVEFFDEGGNPVVVDAMAADGAPSLMPPAQALVVALGQDGKACGCRFLDREGQPCPIAGVGAGGVPVPSEPGTVVYVVSDADGRPARLRPSAGAVTFVTADRSAPMAVVGLDRDGWPAAASAVARALPSDDPALTSPAEGDMGDIDGDPLSPGQERARGDVPIYTMGVDGRVRGPEGELVAGCTLEAKSGPEWEEMEVVVEEEKLIHDASYTGHATEADRMMAGLDTSQRVEIIEDLSKPRQKRLMDPLPAQDKQDLLRLLAGGAAEIPYERMRAMSPEKLTMLLSKTSAEGIASTLVSLKPDELADVLSRLHPKEMARIFVLLSPEVLAHVLATLPDDDSHDFADPLSQTLMAMSSEDLEHVLWKLPSAELALLLSRLQADELLLVLDKLEPHKWRELILRLSPEEAGALLARLPPMWARMFERMEPDDVAAVLLHSSPEGLGKFLTRVPRDDLINILEHIPRDQLIHVILRADGASVARILLKVPKDTLNVIMQEAIAKGKVGPLITMLPPSQVPAVLARLDMAEVAEVLNLLDADTLIAFLEGLSDDELGEVLSRLTAEQRVNLLAKLPEHGRAAELVKRAERSVVARNGDEVYAAIKLSDDVEVRWDRLGTPTEKREAVLMQLPPAPIGAKERLALEDSRLDRMEAAAVAMRDALIHRALTAMRALDKAPAHLVDQFSADHQGVSGDEIDALKSRTEFIEKTLKPKVLKSEASELMTRAKDIFAKGTAASKAAKEEAKAAKANTRLEKDVKKALVAQHKAEASALKADAKEKKKELVDEAKEKKGVAKATLAELKALKGSPDAVTYKSYCSDKFNAKYVKKGLHNPPPRTKEPPVDAAKEIESVRAVKKAVEDWTERQVPLELQKLLLAQHRGSTPDKLTVVGRTAWSKKEKVIAESPLPPPHLWILQGTRDPDHAMHAVLSTYEKVKALWRLLGTTKQKKMGVYGDLGADPANALTRLKAELARLNRLEMAAAAERENMLARASAALKEFGKAPDLELAAKFAEDHTAVSGDGLKLLHDRVEFLEKAAKPKALKLDGKEHWKEAKEEAKQVKDEVKVEGKTKEDLRGLPLGTMLKAYTKSKFYKKWEKKGGPRPPSAHEEPKPTASAVYSWAARAMGWEKGEGSGHGDKGGKGKEAGAKGGKGGTTPRRR